ncbi:hypothetical protein BC831DRAFT_466132, partial [Entophlyctis helioformis]
MFFRHFSTSMEREEREEQPASDYASSHGGQSPVRHQHDGHELEPFQSGSKPAQPDTQPPGPITLKANRLASSPSSPAVPAASDTFAAHADDGYDSDSIEIEDAADEEANSLQRPLLGGGAGAPESTRGRKEVLGLAYMALSALGFSVMSVFVKIAGNTFPSTQVVFVRSVIQLICGVIGCLIVGVEPWGPPAVNKRLLLARGAAGAIGLGFYFFTLINMPLGDGTTIFFIGPAFTAIAAFLFLGEPFTVLDAFASVCCLAGVALVSRPEFIFSARDPTEGTGGIVYKYPRYIPSLSAVFAALVLSVAYCLVRIIGNRVHFMVHVTYFGLVSTGLSFVLLVAFESPVPVMSWTLEQWGIMLSVGIAAFAAQCFLNAGLQLANAGPATLMRNLDIVFAFLFGLWLFHEVPHSTSVIGAVLIGTTTAGVAFIKW